MIRVYKYRLYPNGEQKEYFAKTFPILCIGHFPIPSHPYLSAKSL
ncbi:helix-turn-helix domain-containing protein [Clostridioides sp. ES-S-0108-01]|nr:helix-turn-helix domain-containing protein [Clostridioides sp. ES-S-0108-01]UDN52644.1 helix-turn-helix domain-containing protein [Clostridioides sp. ES-S-0107-01]